MIDHLKLFVIMSNILIGAIVAAYIAIARRRYALPSLRPLFFQVIFYNLLVLLLFTTKYYDINIGEEIFRIPEHLSYSVSYFLVYLFIIGFSYSALGIWVAFLEKKISKRVRRLLVLLAALFLIGPLLEPLLPRESLALSIHFNFFENFGLLFVLMEFGLVISLPFKAKQMKDREKARVVKMFSYLYLSRYPVVALLVLLPQPFRLFLGLLYPNLVPLIWYRYFLLPWFQRSSAMAAESMDMSSVASKYGLSPRETEILGLILQGKNNRDMEEVLFISYHTVKNHVYSIYRKLGVKSRFELLHLLNDRNTTSS